jgi:hypothetical protein
MKRILFLFSFLCLIALMGATAIERTAYTATTEPVLIQQSLDQYFDVGEFLGVTADPSMTDFSLFALYTAPHEAATPEMSLSWSTSINKTSQTIFVNYSPGIAVCQKAAERFLC